MGRSKNYEIPETADPNVVKLPDLESLKESNIVLFKDTNRPRGVIIYSAEKWYMRIWLFLSNSFRYLFTGRTRF